MVIFCLLGADFISVLVHNSVPAKVTNIVPTSVTNFYWKSLYANYFLLRA